MKAIIHDTYGSADVLRADGHRPTRDRRRRGAGARSRGRRGSRRLARDDGPAVPDTPGGLRLPRAQEPGPGHGPRGRRRGGRQRRDQVRGPATRCSASARAPSPSTPRARESKLAPKPANLTFEQAAVVAASGLHRPPGPARPRTAAARGRGADHRRVGRRGHATPCSWPRRSAQRSPACAAPRRSTWSARSAPTTSSTTPATTSPTGERRYDLILDIGGQRVAVTPAGARSRPTGTLVIAGGETGGRWLGGIDRQIRALVLSPFVSQRLGTFISQENARGPDRPQGAHRSRAGHAGHRPQLPAERGRPRRSGTSSRDTPEARSSSPCEALVPSRRAR